MKRSTLAVYRAVAALFAAVILLSVSGFGFVDMMKGPSDMAEEGGPANPSYVEAQLVFIMDIVGVEKNAAGREVAYYAVSPVGDTFVLFHYPAGDMENARRLEEATEAFLMGESPIMEIYMTVTGSMTNINEAEGALLLEWFERNADWMINGGMIAQTEDYSSYLNTSVVRVGQVGGLSRTAVLVLSVLAALLVAYAIVEVVLVVAGACKPAAGNKKETEAPAPVEETTPVEEVTGEEESPAEEKAEETEDA